MKTFFISVLLLLSVIAFSQNDERMYGYYEMYAINDDTNNEEIGGFIYLLQDSTWHYETTYDYFEEGKWDGYASGIFGHPYFHGKFFLEDDVRMFTWYIIDGTEYINVYHVFNYFMFYNGCEQINWNVMILKLTFVKKGTA